jgi:hypothetical protein
VNKLQMDPPLGAGAPSRFFVKAQRVARPPMPWAWAIYEEGRTHPFQCSRRLYRSAEDAWAVGHAMLDRLPKSAIRSPAQQDTDLGDGSTLK